MIKLNLENTNCEIDFASYADKVAEINKMINEKTGKGNDFLGWTTWPKDYDKAELNRIIKSAKFVRENFDVLVVCGIGGSYLGPEFVYEALRNDAAAHEAAKGRELHFIANVDPLDIARNVEKIDPERTLVVIVSKTFTTAETMLNARSLRRWLLEKLG